MSKMIPLPEQAPAASLRVGKTVMSWHWSVWLVSWVPSPCLPPFHSPDRRPLASSAKTAGLEVMRAFDGSALGISTTSIRKIRAIARILAGEQDVLYLGNLDAIRDWGYAPEYVEGMWRILQADRADDYVLATGVGYSVRDFAAAAFAHAGLDWREHVRFDERYVRPTEVDALIGDSTRARVELGWAPTVHAIELAQVMVDADIEALAHAGTAWIDVPRVASWVT